MTELETHVAIPDAELVAGVRSGDDQSMAQLYARHHPDALRVARIVSRDTDADDLAAEAFARVVTRITDGGGPTTGFRAYLHTVIRNLNLERRRRAGREQAASDKPWLLDSVDEAEPEAFEAEVDADRAARALRSLPETWQKLLWRLDVQGSKPAEVARELEVPVTTVSSTVYRAREGLRVAYLDQHVPPADDDRCEWTRARLSRLARGSLTSRLTAKVHQHLSECADCSALYDDLHRLNTKLGAVVWPLVLAGGVSAGAFPWSAPATGAVTPDGSASGSAGGGASGGAGSAGAAGSAAASGGVLAAVPAIAVAVGVVAAVAAGVVHLSGDRADPPVTAAPVIAPAGEADPLPPETATPDDAACAAKADKAKTIAAVAVGDVAAMLPANPPQSLKNLAFNGPDGNPMTLGDRAGKTVLVNLWATWCAPCRAEMPALDALQKEMGSDKFEVVAVNVDTGDAEKPKKFLSETGVAALAQYRDATMGIFEDLKKRGLALGLPVTLLVDDQGCLLANMNGPAEWAGADAKKLIGAALGG